jgi:hypothetical protein
MDTEGLRRAYAEFIAATQQGPFRRPADGGWSAEMVLAHVLVGDRLIAQTASRVMAGENPGFDKPRLSVSFPRAQGLLFELTRTIR